MNIRTFPEIKPRKNGTLTKFGFLNCHVRCTDAIQLRLYSIFCSMNRCLNVSAFHKLQLEKKLSCILSALIAVQRAFFPLTNCAWCSTFVVVLRTVQPTSQFMLSRTAFKSVISTVCSYLNCSLYCIQYSPWIVKTCFWATIYAVKYLALLQIFCTNRRSCNSPPTARDCESCYRSMQYGCAWNCGFGNTGKRFTITTYVPHKAQFRGAAVLLWNCSEAITASISSLIVVINFSECDLNILFCSV